MAVGLIIVFAFVIKSRLYDKKINHERTFIHSNDYLSSSSSPISSSNEFTSSGLSKVKKSSNLKGYFDGNLTQSDLHDNFSNLTWQNAEDLVGKLFEKKGFSVNVTQRSADFGIDVEAKNSQIFLGIQVKHWNHDVGFEDVAKTLGVGQKFNKVIIVNTKRGFTNQAWEHANNNPYLIELWDSEKFKQELRAHFI